MAKTVDVLLSLPIDQLFSYAIEENTEILLGDYVVVPFGKKRLIGIVWKYSDKSNRELKFIEQKIDLPNIRPKLIAFAEWVAQYNLIPIGMLAKVIMGGVLKVNHIDKLVCVEQKQETSEISCQLSPEQQIASDKIISNLNEYSVTLLDGETGSGKTEVYLSVIAQLIKNYTAVPVFGALKEWQEAQKIDAKQFEEVFSALKEWQEAQKIDVEQFEKVFSALEDKIGTKQFQAMQEHLNGLQEKVETLAEAVADQQKIMAICIIVSAVAAIAITSFVAFCIYQGVKLDKEKKNDLSKDTPDAKLSNVDTTDGTEKLQNNLKVANI